MANTKSAKKRININKRNRLRNKYYKTSVKNLLKLFYSNLNSDQTLEKEKLQKILNSIYSLIDKGTKKKIFHKNTAARKKSKLTASLKYLY